MNVSFSASSDAVASSRRITGASFKSALAIEILCLSPPDSAEPFSPITVLYPLGSLSINSSHWASFAALITSSSVAPFLPILIFSIIVLSKSVTSWNTIEYARRSFSGSTCEISLPPSLMLPPSASQNLAASFDTVDFPPPDGPISAVTSPCFAVKLISLSTFSLLSYEKLTFENSISYDFTSSSSFPFCTG